LWVRLRRRQISAGTEPASESPDAAPLTSAAELERVLGAWVRWWTRSRADESDQDLVQAGQRVEAELVRFFGQDTLQRVQGACCGASPGGGTIFLTADRLFVAFLGTRAAMAVTRKVYSNLQ
jgi:hypothetical protein